MNNEIGTPFGPRRRKPPWRVALVCRDRHTGLGWHWAQVAQAAVETLSQAGCLVRVITTEGRHAKSAAFLCWLRADGVDGAIDLENEWTRRRGPPIRACQFPLVCMWALPPQARVEADHVAVDEAMVARLALEHLHALGHPRCGYVLISRAPPVEARFAAFVETARRLGMYDASLVLDLRPDLGRVSAVPDFHRFDLVPRFLRGQRTPLALFTHHDYVAASLVETLIGLGYRVPDDVAVVGVDDDPLYSLANQGLTTLRLPTRAMGIAAANLLLARLHKPGGRCRCVMLEPKLVARQSTVGHGANAEWLLLALETIRQHCHEPDVLPSLRQRLGLNRKTLARRFRQAMGCTLLEYRNRSRMERASHLLIENPGAKITAVAREVGFTAPGRFAPLFREHFGMTPVEYHRRKAPIADAGRLS